MDSVRCPMKHKDCGGRFTHYVIREHGYSFQRCDDCGHYFGGAIVAQKVSRLMRTKVRPTIRRA